MPRLNPDGSRLAGADVKDFIELIVDAFSLDELRVVLATQLDKKLDRISLKDNLDHIVFDLIEDAERKSWTAELLQAVRAERQHHLGLYRFAQKFALEPSLAAAEEVMVRESDRAVDPEVWLRGGLRRLGQVCRIEIGVGGGSATGFLVGPDLVLTNEHVMRHVIAGNVRRRAVKARFDVRADLLGGAAGTVAGLAENWLVDVSPNTDAPYHDIQTTTLDYALLRLDTRRGHDIVDGDEIRGWVDVANSSTYFERNTPLFLLGHPRGDSLKLTLDTQSILGVNNSDKTRIRYRTNTEPGSSGSPCFDLDWNIVALHHAGDSEAIPPYNQGIPIVTIVAEWERKVEAAELEDWQRQELGLVLGDQR